MKIKLEEAKTNMIKKSTIKNFIIAIAGLTILSLALSTLYIIELRDNKFNSSEVTRLINKSKDERNEISELRMKNIELQTQLDEQSKWTFLGNFKLSHYGADCKGCNNITATGTTATKNRTVAVDPSKIAYGSILKINGIEYVAEDTGGSIKGNKLDIYVGTEAQAKIDGVKYADVYIRKE